jgi:hypothetical protein
VGGRLGGVHPQISRPGKPVDNTFIAAFTGGLHDECLYRHWFFSLADARRSIERRTRERKR